MLESGQFEASACRIGRVMILGTVAILAQGTISAPMRFAGPFVFGQVRVVGFHVFGTVLFFRCVKKAVVLIGRPGVAVWL